MVLLFGPFVLGASLFRCADSECAECVECGSESRGKRLRAWVDEEVPLAHCLYPHCIPWKKIHDGTGTDGWDAVVVLGARRVWYSLLWYSQSSARNQPGTAGGDSRCR